MAGAFGVGSRNEASLQPHPTPVCPDGGPLKALQPKGKPGTLGRGPSDRWSRPLSLWTASPPWPGHWKTLGWMRQHPSVLSRSPASRGADIVMSDIGQALPNDPFNRISSGGGVAWSLGEVE